MTMVEAVQTTVFAVDDDLDILAFVARVARGAGYVAKTFATGKEMLEHLDDRPAAIVLDMTMPGLDGFEVIDALAARGYAGHLVIASGFSGDVTHMAEILARRKGLRVAGAIAKPFTAAQLRALLAVSGETRDAS